MHQAFASYRICDRPFHCHHHCGCTVMSLSQPLLLSTKPLSDLPLWPHSPITHTNLSGYMPSPHSHITDCIYTDPWPLTFYRAWFYLWRGLMGFEMLKFLSAMSCISYVAPFFVLICPEALQISLQSFWAFFLCNEALFCRFHYVNIKLYIVHPYMINDHYIVLLAWTYLL